MGLWLGDGAAQAAEPEAKVKPCIATKFSTKEVEKACKEGGQKAAKKLMKKVVKAAKAKGEKMNCKSCHSDLKTFKLKDGASAQLKKLLAG